MKKVILILCVVLFAGCSEHGALGSYSVKEYTNYTSYKLFSTVTPNGATREWYYLNLEDLQYRIALVRRMFPGYSDDQILVETTNEYIEFKIYRDKAKIHTGEG